MHPLGSAHSLRLVDRSKPPQQDIVVLVVIIAFRWPLDERRQYATSVTHIDDWPAGIGFDPLDYRQVAPGLAAITGPQKACSTRMPVLVTRLGVAKHSGLAIAPHLEYRREHRGLARRDLDSVRPGGACIVAGMEDPLTTLGNRADVHDISSAVAIGRQSLAELLLPIRLRLCRPPIGSAVVADDVCEHPILSNMHDMQTT